jgi:hypothetical protein
MAALFLLDDFNLSKGDRHIATPVKLEAEGAFFDRGF